MKWVLLAKSHVKAHTRTLASGEIVRVAAYTDKRTKRAGAPGKGSGATEGQLALEEKAQLSDFAKEQRWGSRGSSVDSYRGGHSRLIVEQAETREASLPVVTLPDEIVVFSTDTPAARKIVAALPSALNIIPVQHKRGVVVQVVSELPDGVRGAYLDCADCILLSEILAAEIQDAPALVAHEMGHRVLRHAIAGHLEEWQRISQSAHQVALQVINGGWNHGDDAYVSGAVVAAVKRGEDADREGGDGEAAATDELFAHLYSLAATTRANGKIVHPAAQLLMGRVWHEDLAKAIVTGSDYPSGVARPLPRRKPECAGPDEGGGGSVHSEVGEEGRSCAALLLKSVAAAHQGGAVAWDAFPVGARVWVAIRGRALQLVKRADQTFSPTGFREPEGETGVTSPSAPGLNRMVLLEKSHVAAHTRTLPSGKRVHVKAYETKAPAAHNTPAAPTTSTPEPDATFMPRDPRGWGFDAAQEVGWTVVPTPGRDDWPSVKAADHELMMAVEVLRLAHGLPPISLSVVIQEPGNKQAHGGRVLAQYRPVDHSLHLYEGDASVLHEVAHAIDHQVLGPRNAYPTGGSEGTWYGTERSLNGSDWDLPDDPGSRLHEVLTKSPYVQRMKEHFEKLREVWNEPGGYNRRVSIQDAEKYFLRTQEMFARAYTRWALQRALEVKPDWGYLIQYAYDGEMDDTELGWTPEEWAPVRAVLDDVIPALSAEDLTKALAALLGLIPPGPAPENRTVPSHA